MSEATKKVGMASYGLSGGGAPKRGALSVRRGANMQRYATGDSRRIVNKITWKGNFSDSSIQWQLIEINNNQ